MLPSPSKLLLNEFLSHRFLFFKKKNWIVICNATNLKSIANLSFILASLY